MKKFPMLNVILQLIIALTVGVVEKIFVFLYCMLPIGLFMAIMSLRDKNHKMPAISTFTSENSEFQHIFPNYILVIIEPNYFKKLMNSRIKSINTFLDKYKLIIAFMFILSIIALFVWVFLNYSSLLLDKIK